MKKFYFLTLALICAFVANAADIPAGTKLYLTPNSNWKTDNARFAAYFFGNNDSNAWASMEFVVDGTYSVTAPEGTWTNVIFCRMNSNSTENNWDNKWNQTGNLTYDGTNNHYTVAEGAWDNGDGSWSKLVEIVGGTVLYLKPNANWNQSNARFAAYFFGNNDSNAWASMEFVVDGTYSVTAPEGTWTNVIFCRMNPNSTENNWDNKWTQTGNLTYDGTNNLYTINDGSWDAGTWSVAGDTITAIEEVGVDAGAAVYYNLQGVKVANPENGIFIKKQGNRTSKVVL